MNNIVKGKAYVWSQGGRTVRGVLGGRGAEVGEGGGEGPGHGPELGDRVPLPPEVLSEGRGRDEGGKAGGGRRAMEASRA